MDPLADLQVGVDPWLISSVTLRSTEVTARLFLPMIGPGGRWESWQHACGLAGVTLDGRTAWVDLEALLPEGWGFTPEPGDVDRRTARSMIEVFGADQPVTAVFWIVYAQDRPDPSECEPLPEGAGRSRWHDGAHLAMRTTLGRLIDDVFEESRQWPVCVAPDSREFLIAAPGYSDSLYLSCTASSASRLAAAGLDLRHVDRRDAFAPRSWD